MRLELWVKISEIYKTVNVKKVFLYIQKRFVIRVQLIPFATCPDMKELSISGNPSGWLIQSQKASVGKMLHRCRCAIS